MKHAFLYPALILILLLNTHPAFSGSQALFTNLKEQLIRDGFDKKKIDRLYSNKKLAFDVPGISLFFVHSEYNLDYEQFISKTSIKNAETYMDKYMARLTEAEKKYGVDKTIITAILLIESRLGTYTGNRLVINSLSTMASLKYENVKNTFYSQIKDKRKLSRKKFNQKARYRSKWAYNELKAFLEYTTREGLDPFKITGSYAGALGFSQFIPSNALRLAVDGNNDGSINLFHHPDAIYSIANFLSHHGWKPSITRQKAYKVLYKYNRSKPYVTTLLKISHHLKGLKGQSYI